MHHRRNLGGLGLAVAAVCFTWNTFPVAARAQESQPIPEGEMEDFINKISTLVLPQQKDLAREMIRKHPGTPVAELARKLLAEYELYGSLKAREQQHLDARTKFIREFWDARRYPTPTIPAALVTIVNRYDEPILYQVKLPSMQWTGPYRLPADATHRFRGPILVRRVTAAGVTTYPLFPYTRYVFADPQGTDTPRLYVDDTPRDW